MNKAIVKQKLKQKHAMVYYEVPMQQQYKDAKTILLDQGSKKRLCDCM